MCADEELIRELLEEIMDSGAPPEAVCGGHPELTAEVRRRWRRLQSVNQQVEALFPSRARSAAQSASPLTDAPQIPGYEGATFVGRGGMGVVYKARHISLGRTVAIKMLLPGLHSGPDEIEALLREAAAVAALQHPNIVQVFDVGNLDGRPYFTMEFLDGGSLTQKTAGTPQPPRQAAELVAILADAVQAAHTGGIVHRDIKPGNILFTADGRAKLADFSLARRITSDPSVTLVNGGGGAGTPSYMAPEQAMGRSSRCEPAVDIYALGAVLYDLLTGRAPFKADSPAETHRQVIEEDPAPPSRLNARVPRDLETICLKCLEKDPLRRYPTAAALADDLRRFVDGRPITARRAGPAERAAKWARRHPAQATLLLCIMLAAAAAIGALFWLGSQRAALHAAVQEDLRTVAGLETAARWEEARQVVGLARTRLGGKGGSGGGAALRAQLDEADRDIAMAQRLDSIRMERILSVERRFDQLQFDGRYLELFQETGVLKAITEPPPQIAARINASPIRAALLNALNDWAFCTNDKGELQRLLVIARSADPDPVWRDRVRNVMLWSDRAALRQLAADASLDPHCVALTSILAGVLQGNGDGDEAIDMLRRVQRANPSNFWANFNLAEYLDERQDPEAIGFYRAAQALRPDSVAASINLGLALTHNAMMDEAEQCWRNAIAIDPRCAPAYTNLAIVALGEDRLDDAISLCEKAIEVRPDWSAPYDLLGDAHSRQGRWDESIANMTKALRLMPQDEPQRQDAAYRLKRYTTLQTMERRLSDYASGAATPANATECFDLAEVFINKGDLARAIDFFVRSFEADPQVPKNPAQSRMYVAAYAAVGAAKPSPDGGGGGGGGGGADEQARASYRRQGLAWLRTLFEAWAKVVSSGSERERREAARTLRRWQQAPELASVRDEPELARLEQSDADKWRAFWRDVAALRSEAATPK